MAERWPSRENGETRAVWPNRKKVRRVFLLVRVAPMSRPILLLKFPEKNRLSAV